jgi:hypothetical protein
MPVDSSLKQESHFIGGLKMVDQNESLNTILNHIQSLRNFLKSEVSINQTDEKQAVLTIKVFDEASESHDSGNIVFVGVGLRLIDCRGPEKGGNYWPSRIKKTRLSDQDTLRRQFGEGNWSGGSEGFPIVTSDENSHGEVLFPGESVRYEINVPKNELPYLYISVEGTMSRRHLFHVSRPIGEIDLLRKPLVVDTFRLVNNIDIFSPLVAIANELPSVGLNTTFADVDSIKTQLEKGRAHLKRVINELNGTFRSAPGRELQDYIAEIAKYIKTVGMAFDATQKVLSSGDMPKLKQAVDEMKGKLLGIDEVKRKKADIIAKFNISS